MSNFTGLHIGLTGIRAGQTGLETASNNIANANTPGYTRQRVDLAQRTTLQVAAGRIGTGVDVGGVNRMREDFLDTRARTTGATFAESDTLAAMLQRVEDVVGEPDSGLSGLLDQVWDAFEDLANDPGDTAARQQVLSSLNAVAGRFQAIDRGLAQLQSDTQERLEGGVTDVNELLAEVDALNKEIASATSPPNDLHDRRDLALDQLSTLAGAEATVVTTGERTGMVDVQIGGQPALDGNGVSAIAQDGAGNLEPTGVRGELGALQQLLTDGDEGLPAWRAELDGFAQSFTDAINTAHADGTDANGDPGTSMLDFGDPGADPRAGSIQLALTDPAQIVAGWGDGPLDGRNAARMAELRDGDLPSAWRNTAVELGRATANATQGADAQEGLYTSAQNARASAHGVSIDEEMVSLVQLQRALEASSRVMTTIDEALDVLINRTGLVGR